MIDTYCFVENNDLKNYMFYLEEVDDKNYTLEDLEKQITFECYIEEYLKKTPMKKLNTVFKNKINNAFTNYVCGHVNTYIRQ